MAKITLRNFEELLVSEERANQLQQLVAEKKLQGVQLNIFPVTIETTDKTLWCGSLADIGPITLNTKVVKTHKHNFQSREDLIRFHNDYGYGGLTPEFKPGYGLVDVQTQFLIKTKQFKLENQLIKLNLPEDVVEKWQDLWYYYTQSLDEFNELC